MGWEKYAKVGEKMNYNNTLFDELIQTIIPNLNGCVCPPSLQDPEKQFYAKEYTDNLLVSLLHSNRDDYKTPQRALEIAFSAGFFCQMLDTLSEQESEEKTSFIISILRGNVFTMGGRMVGLLLNSDAASIKAEHDDLQQRATEACQFLTYQTVLDMAVEELYTICFAMFLIGCSVNIDYKLT